MNKNLKIGLSIVGVLIILVVGVYIAGNVMIPNSIRTSYQSKDCKQVLSLNEFYTSTYLPFMVDKSIVDLTQECASYSSATETEQQKDWQTAYSAYKAYKNRYPSGLFIKEADEHSAQLLLEAAKEQKSAQKYADALANINLVLADFSATNAVNEAASLMYDTYIAWAKNQSSAGDFAASEATLKKLVEWAEISNKDEYLKFGQNELAQTYLAWGLSFQKTQEFEKAKTKFELANIITPNIAKKNETHLYMEWAVSLIAKNDFVNAEDYYEKALFIADSEDQIAIKDQIANLHLKQAENLSNVEDFEGALKEIAQVKSLIVTDEIKKRIEESEIMIYQAFSKSSGKQAQAAMWDAAQKICKHEKLETPIFGLDESNIHAYLSISEELKLTDKIQATTPASLHYVACVLQSTKSEKQTRSAYHFVRGIPTTTSGVYITAERVINYWDIKLYDIKTGKEVAKQLFTGSSPISWPEIQSFLLTKEITSDMVFSGNTPDIGTVSAWIEKYIK